MIELFGVLIGSLIVGFLAFRFADWFYLKMGWLDNPRVYGFSRSPVPYSVGLMIALCFVAIVSWVEPLNWKVLTILIGGGVLSLMAFLDDRYKLSAVWRLLVQLVIVMIVLKMGVSVSVLANPLGGVVELGAWSWLVSGMFVVSLINLMNFLDGVSGLSSGVSFVGFLVIFVLSSLPGMHQTDQSLVQVMSVVLMSLSLLAFLFEFPTPKMLIGDSGTMFFGFMLGVLSMLSGGKLATVSLVLLIPIFDGAWVISRRMLNKKSPLKGDLEHLHHRLERVGLSKEAILLIYMMLSLVFGLIAIFVWNTFFKVISLLLLFSGLSIIGYFIWIKEKR